MAIDVSPDAPTTHEPTASAPAAQDPTSALGLWWTDYLALLTLRGPESAGKTKLLALPRLLTNPTLQALLALRLANASPRPTWWFWRSFFIRAHSCDWMGPLEIGPGLQMPHPIGIMLLRGAKIGRDVMLSHNVTLGGARDGGTPVLGDRVTLYPGVVVVGGQTIGDDSVVSANCIVQRDVPPGRLVTQRGVIPIDARRGEEGDDQ